MHPLDALVDKFLGEGMGVVEGEGSGNDKGERGGKG